MDYLPSLSERRKRFSQYIESCCGGPDIPDEAMNALPDTDPTPMDTKLDKVIKKRKRRL